MPGRKQKRTGRPERKGDFDASVDSSCSEDASSSSGGEEHIDLRESRRRLSAAKKHLWSLAGKPAGDDDSGEVDAAQLDREMIAERLARETAIAKGKFIGPLAIAEVRPAGSWRANGRPATAVAFRDASTFYTADKSCWILEWSRGAVRRRMQLPRRTVVLCMAVCSDGSLLASGHADGTISVWSTASGTCLSTCQQPHKGAVLSLSFQRVSSAPTEASLGERTSAPESHGTLYSASVDRAIRLWTVDSQTHALAVLDTLYGHQDEVMSVATLGAEQCVSAGGRDNTVRAWKIVDQSQLLFRPSVDASGSFQDAVAMLDEATWVTASGAAGEPHAVNALSLWVSHKKKPVAVAAAPSAITALAVAPYTDAVFTGHADGSIRQWRASPDARVLDLVRECAQLRGIVNALALNADQTLLVAACGMEPRLGRWTKATIAGGSSRSACNRVHVFALRHE